MASVRSTKAFKSLQQIYVEGKGVCKQDARSVFYEQLRMEIVSRLPTLPNDVLLTLSRICSPELWQSLSANERCTAGAYFRRMVWNGEFYGTSEEVILQVSGSKTNCYSIHDGRKKEGRIFRPVFKASF
ncbi:hypothetical protein GTP41_20065 [Pseudoduganella sp. DS3]|uniref:Uncharacterized protein n=1 Tax=Pseudoduganella guangdongensis TaxID=2692179 RepID=A0A6N9HNI1_9BURK|nr:hypothetical protein [Pseudoduganella guangdongensis]MYN04392.1 hypothetical protein [Pseudoduganella guangdongensis]